MSFDPRTLPDQADILYLATAREDDVAAALDALAEEDGMRRVDPAGLWPLGPWPRGGEAFSARFLLAPPAQGFTTMLLSTRDWDHVLAPRLAERLDCRAAYLMLHDADVFTCHLHDRGRCLLGWLSSPAHFDVEVAPSLEAAADAIEAFTGARSSVADVAAALAPPGRIDVDGQLAFVRSLGLLGLPLPPVACYRDALAEDRLSPLPALSAWRHVAYQLRDSQPGMPAAPDGARSLPRELPPGVVPFRPRR